MENPTSNTTWTEAEEKRIAELMEEKKCSRIDAVKLMRAEKAIKEHRPKRAVKMNRKADATGISDEVKARLAKKRAPKAKLVTRYRSSAKQPTKALTEKDTQSARIYRLIAKAKGNGLTYEEIVKGLDRKGLINDPQTISNCVRWYISKLKSNGFILSSSEHEEKSAKPERKAEPEPADNRLAKTA